MNTKNNLILISLLMLFTSCSNVTVKTNDEYKAVDLPDGSTVLLNHSSCITYNKEFKERCIIQEGEALYMVVPGQKPFTVITDAGKIKVTGTEFNVKADENNMEVEVEDGTVEIKIRDIVKSIERGEKAVYDKGKDLFEKGPAEFKHRIWTDDMKKEFKKMGRELKKSGGKAGREIEKATNEIIRSIKK